MAVQIWTPFTADQHIARGGADLGAGIGGGLANLGDAISKALDKKKQQGALATSLRKTLSVAYPDRKDEFATMGLPDLQGTLEGEAIKSAQAKARQQEQLQAEQLADAISRRQSREALPAIAAQLAEMGQAPESVPTPFSNAEFARRTAPIDGQALMSAIARTRAPIDPGDAASLMTALDRMRPQAPRGLPLGATRAVDGLGTIVGTGDAFEPNFVPTPRPTKEDVEVPSYPWLFSNDNEQFTKGITSLPPKERDAAIAARTAYNRSVGRFNPLEEYFLEALSGRNPNDKKGTASPSKIRKFNPTTGKLE